MNMMKIVVFMLCLAMCVPVKATVAYTYENDNKTLVATVTDADTALTTSAADQAWFTNYAITNFVKRGAKNLNVWESVANSFSGDIRIEDGGNLSFYGNALGINNAQGKIQIYKGNLVHIGNNKHLTIAKDIEFCLGSGNNDWGGRTIQVWSGHAGTISGKVTIGNRNAYAYVYENGSLTFTGGIEDPSANTRGYFYVGAYSGSTVTFAEKPLKLANMFYFSIPDYVANAPNTYRDATGYVGHYIFSAPSNTVGALGYANDTVNSRLRLYDVKTTVDWVFDKSNMTVWWGNDARWDLCGTEQRVGQFDVRVATGNASVVTNASATPATLHMGMIYTHGNDTIPPNIRFGGNLSVVFEGNIYTTKVDHVMTAAGNLTVLGNGNYLSRLEFLENGSWANATNVTVSGNAKMTIANSNALGRKANVNLKSNSSLEIASGVTVNVRTLTVNGVQQPRGEYTFGGGTLSVQQPSGLTLKVR
ncbi:MAG: hypothetical protein IKE55_01115 [Kiritimatiellae bacterium]|nr:hypothetical protein [Kiritimatiellia bacterium]